MTRSATSSRKRGAAPKAAPSGTGASRPGVLWAAPAAAFFALFAVVPLIMVAVLSFAAWDGLSDPEFAGLANWRKLLDDPVMVKSLWLSVLLTGLGVIVQTPLSILLGVWAAAGPVGGLGAVVPTIQVGG
ncbi:hypothetical protein ABZ943_36370, partial [Streptomyces rubiginosohelvolus]